MVWCVQGSSSSGGFGAKDLKLSSYSLVLSVLTEKAVEDNGVGWWGDMYACGRGNIAFAYRSGGQGLRPKSWNQVGMAQFWLCHVKWW